MGMAGQGQRYAVGISVKISGSWISRMTGSAVLIFLQRTGQIVDAAESAVAEPASELVAQPGRSQKRRPPAPSSTASFSHHRNAHLRQRRARSRYRATSQ